MRTYFSVFLSTSTIPYKMPLKLHGLAMSSCTALVLSCIHEKGIDFELLPVDLSSGQHKQPPFLAKNPFGQIPVLEDGDLTIFESRAISAYIAEKFKETGCDLIRHKNINEAALVKVWAEVESQNYSPAIFPIVYQYLVAPFLGQNPNQEIINTNLENLAKVLDVYEAKLSTTKYLAGDFYSLADLHHFPFTYYFMKSPWASLVNDRPHVKAWWEDISTRPASKKVAEGMVLGQK